MYFILSSECVNYCQFMPSETRVVMEPEKLLEGLRYAFENFYQPVFVHSADSRQWLEDLLEDEKYGDLLAAELKRGIIIRFVIMISRTVGTAHTDPAVHALLFTQILGEQGL